MFSFPKKMREFFWIGMIFFLRIKHRFIQLLKVFEYLATVSLT